jgi:hypothetical protein
VAYGESFGPGDVVGVYIDLKDVRNALKSGCFVFLKK